MIDYFRIVLLTGLIVYFLGITIWRRNGLLLKELLNPESLSKWQVVAGVPK